MESLFNELSPSEYEHRAFEVARGRATLSHNKHESQHQATSSSPGSVHTSSALNHLSTASTAISAGSQSSSSSTSKDAFRQLTREILNFPVFQSIKETDSSLAS